jgi:WD40 repeat protein
MTTRIALSLLALSLLAWPASADPLFHYGALAIDRHNGFYYGWANDHPTLQEATDRAVAECVKRGGRCHVVLAWSGRGCGAYRTIDGQVGTAYGWGVAPTREQADAIARTEADKRSKGAPATRFVWGCNASETEAFRPLYDAGGAAEPRMLSAQKDEVRRVAVSPDSKTIASADRDGVVRLWDVATGALTRTLAPHERDAFDVAYSPDGRWLASAHLSGTVVLWNAGTGELVHRLSAHASSATAVAFSPDGRTLASGASSGWGIDDGGVKLWDVATGRETEHFRRVFTGGVNALAYAADGMLAVGGLDKDRGNDFSSNLKVRRGGGWQSIGSFDNDVYHLAFSRDGGRLAGASLDGTAQVYAVPAFRALHVLRALKIDTVRAVAFSPDGEELATGHTDGGIRIWDGASGTLRETLTGHQNRKPVNGLAYAPNGRFLVSGCEDRTVRIWPREGADDARLAAILKAEQGAVHAAAKTRALTGASEARRKRDAARQKP